MEIVQQDHCENRQIDEHFKRPANDVRCSVQRQDFTTEKTVAFPKLILQTGCGFILRHTLIKNTFERLGVQS